MSTEPSKSRNTFGCHPKNWRLTAEKDNLHIDTIILLLSIIICSRSCTAITVYGGFIFHIQPGLSSAVCCQVLLLMFLCFIFLFMTSLNLRRGYCYCYYYYYHYYYFEWAIKKVFLWCSFPLWLSSSCNYSWRMLSFLGSKSIFKAVRVSNLFPFAHTQQKKSRLMMGRKFSVNRPAPRWAITLLCFNVSVSLLIM